MKLLRLDTVDSTNTLAKELCRKQPENTEILLITARQQTAGRGRTGKSFSSLRDNGLYMTVVIPIGKKPQDCLFLTIATAVAVLEVLTENGCKELGIKWVNDLYQNDRKVCGILTEAVTNPENGIMSHAVIGVGINLGTDLSLLPEELQNKAGSLMLNAISGEELSIRLAEHISDLAAACFEGGQARIETMEKYRKYSILPGRNIFWETAEGTQEGTAAGIDDDGHLLVDTEDGRVCLDSGYVSVKF